MPRVPRIDLLDPDEETLRRTWPDELHPSALQTLVTPQHIDEPRPTLKVHGDYVLGLFVVPVVVAEEDRVYYQQVHLLLNRSLLVTVRKTPPEGEPFDTSDVFAACDQERRASAGMYAYHLIDEVAERFLTLIDDVTAEIDELEEHLEDWPPQKVRERLSTLRRDLLEIRRILSPTRDAVRAIGNNRLEIEGDELFPHEVEVHFGNAYDKFLRASEGIEVAREFLAGVRDYHQAKVANDQNEVMKRLTAIASILLVPTLIVGVYGQNLEGGPEFDWAYGYEWSLGLIVVATLAQLAYFKKKGWI